MVKLTGPMLGNAANGTLAGQLIFSSSKGRPYLKRHKKPKQPDTIGQVAMRAMMAFLSVEWQHIGAANQWTWLAEAHKHNLAPINVFQRENLTRWRSRRPPSMRFPATEQSTPAPSIYMEATGGVRHATLDLSLKVRADDNWTGLLFHKFGSSPLGTWDRLVHVEVLADLDVKTWKQSPLPAGTHYYRIMAASDDGNLELINTWSANCVVTD